MDFWLGLLGGLVALDTAGNEERHQIVTDTRYHWKVVMVRISPSIPTLKSKKVGAQGSLRWLLGLKIYLLWPVLHYTAIFKARCLRRKG